MKLIFENKYLHSYKFKFENEYKTFLSNQKVPVSLILPEHGGRFFYCYIGFNSLNSEKLFAIGFESDVSQEELSFLSWGETGLYALDNGKEVFLINNNMVVIASFPITTPLIGFYVTSKNMLLLLYEAEMRLVSKQGDIQQYEQFDLLEDYRIMNSSLFLESGGLTKIIEL